MACHSSIWSLHDGIKNVNKTSKTVALDIPGEITTCWSTYSPTLNRFYISDPTNDIITEVSVDEDLVPSVVAVRKFQRAGSKTAD
jgi:hypothetical protein